MYLLITIIAALLVGLVLVVLVQNIFGAPEPSGVENPVWGPGCPGVGGYGNHSSHGSHSNYSNYGGPRFRIVRRGYDIADVDRYLANLEGPRETPEGALGAPGTPGENQGQTQWGAPGGAQREEHVERTWAEQ